jgi:twinkle protein
MKRQLGDVKVEVRSASDYIFYRGKRDQPLPGERPPPGIDVQMHSRLMTGKEPDVLDYLTKARGFTTETLERFKIGVAGEGQKLLIAIPHYFNSELVCVKFRSVPPAKKTFSRWKDCPSVLFNGDCLHGMESLPPRERRVMVCEGEFDAMSWVQLGFEKVVSTTTGAGRSDWPAEWLAPIEPATTVYLGYDADNAGEEGAEKAAAVIGRYRAKRVVPPLKDWNACLSAGVGRATFDECIMKAREYDENVVKPSSAFGDDLLSMLDKDQPRGRSTGWITLDAILGGVRDCEMTVVTGDTGSGKTTWTTALCRNQLLQDVPCLVAPFEQKPADVVGKLVGMDARQSIFDMKRDDVKAGISKVVDRPLYFIDIHGTAPLGVIKDAIYIAVRRFGVKFIVLDHLHFFIESGNDNERQVIDATMRAMALWVQDLDVHICLVVHPKGLQKDKQGRVRKVTLGDLKGSSEIQKTAWNIVRVWRDRKDTLGSRSDTTEIGVLKCRSNAGSEGAMELHFDRNGEVYLESMSPTYSNYQDIDDLDDDFNEAMWNTPH